MSSFFRRAGSRILRTLSSAATPAPSGAEALVYARPNAFTGNTGMYSKNSANGEYLLTQDVPQALTSPCFYSAASDVALVNNNCYALFMGYTWRDFLGGGVSTFQFSWRHTIAAAGLVWGEIGIATGPYINGLDPQVLTAIAFLDVGALMSAAAASVLSTVTLAGAGIGKGQPIWALIGANTTVTPPTVTGGLGTFDSSASGQTVVQLGVYRPSAQLGVPANFFQTANNPRVSMGTPTGF